MQSSFNEQPKNLVDTLLYAVVVLELCWFLVF